MLSNLHTKNENDRSSHRREIDVLVGHSDFDANDENLTSGHSNEVLTILCNRSNFIFFFACTTY